MRMTLSLFGPFRLSLDGRELPIRSRRGQAMLAMLALAPGSAVSRDRLAATLWPDRAEPQARASLRQELSALRKRLGAGGALITADATCIRIDSSALDRGISSAGVGEFLEGLDIRSEPFDDWRRAEAARLQAGALVASDVPHDIFDYPSVLVAGFTPAGPSDEDIAFATGLVSDLRTALALWRWFPVIGPEVIGWKTDHEADLVALAARVKAAYLICGGIRRAGGRVRVSASLTDVATRHIVWTETFEGELHDVFELQEAIGRAVVARVTPEIGRAEAARVTRARPGNMAAWQLLAQTEELERTGGEGYGTPESNRAQVPLLERALGIEPDYGRALARLARYHFRAALQGWTEDREGALKTALDLSSRAMECDPQEWEAQTYHGLNLVFGFQRLGPGRHHASEGVRLNPSAPIARHGLGCALEWLGEPAESLKHLRLVFELNPNHFNRAAVLGDITTCELILGNIGAAVAAARRLRDIAPNYSRGLQRVAVTLGHAGHLEEAADALARVHALQADFDEAYVRETYPYANPDHLDLVIGGLRKAGWKG